MNQKRKQHSCRAGRGRGDDEWKLFPVTIVIGILGAVLGGFIATALGMGTVSGFNLGSFVIAILGAILLLWLYRVVKSR